MVTSCHWYGASKQSGVLLRRVAPSFVRLGTFQLPASRGGGEEVLTKQVADYGELSSPFARLVTTWGNTLGCERCQVPV
jgi:uncharacterized protein YdiU (UPF0061 family)